jgi:RarD protein
MLKSYIKLITALLIFGSIGLFVREIPLASGEIVLARTSVGSVFLIIILLFKRQKNNIRVLLQKLPLLIVSGGALGFSWIFLFAAYRYTSVSIATLAYYCAPILVLLLSPLILKEKLTHCKIIGILAAMVGMVLVNGAGASGEAPLKGLICGLMSALLYAVLMLVNKLIKGISGLEITLIQLMIAAIVILPYALYSHKGAWVLPTGRGLVSLIVLCLVHTGFACYLYFSSIQELPGQTIALCSYIDPLSALLFSAVFLNERLTAVQIAGAALILGGAAFGELFKRKAYKTDLVK